MWAIVRTGMKVLKTTDALLDAGTEVALTTEVFANTGRIYAEANRDFIQQKVSKKNELKLAELDSELELFQLELKIKNQELRNELEQADEKVKAKEKVEKTKLPTGKRRK